MEPPIHVFISLFLWDLPRPLNGLSNVLEKTKVPEWKVRSSAFDPSLFGRECCSSHWVKK